MTATEDNGVSITGRVVSQSFLRRTVLDEISFNIAQGEFVAIVGPSGCGKSTLLRLLAGLERPTQGTIEIGGGAQTPMQRACVFQEPALLPWRTVSSNVGLPLEFSRVARSDRRQRVLDRLTQVGLTAADASKLPRQLSGGMRMRVSIARALVTNPQLLLLDEPFAALDDLLRQRLNEELHRLWCDQRWTVALVTHNVAEAVFLANRVLVMAADPGRIVAEIRVPFPSPRDFDLRSSAAFSQIVADVSRCLRLTESPRGDQAETTP